MTQHCPFRASEPSFRPEKGIISSHLCRPEPTYRPPRVIYSAHVVWRPRPTAHIHRGSSPTCAAECLPLWDGCQPWLKFPKMECIQVRLKAVRSHHFVRSVVGSVLWGCMPYDMMGREWVAPCIWRLSTSQSRWGHHRLLCLARGTRIILYPPLGIEINPVPPCPRIYLTAPCDRRRCFAQHPYPSVRARMSLATLKTFD